MLTIVFPFLSWLWEISSSGVADNKWPPIRSSGVISDKLDYATVSLFELRLRPKKYWLRLSVLKK